MIVVCMTYLYSDAVYDDGDDDDDVLFLSDYKSDCYFEEL